MGLGKTTAIFNHMKEDPNKKYIYATPFLSEAHRAKDYCNNLHFREPVGNLPEYEFSKITHTKHLIEEGCNIVTTHESLKFYTKEMIELIKEHSYTLVIDESIDMLENYNETTLSKEDLDILEKAGYVRNEGRYYSILNTDYKYGGMRHLFKYLKSKDLIILNDEYTGNKYWKIPIELITSFEDVYVLTYLFEHQGLHHMLTINNVEYRYVGVRTINGNYELCDLSGSINYIPDIGKKIHVLDNEKMNCIGKGKYALSHAWYGKESSDVERVRKNLSNYFQNIYRDVNPSEKMWTCYKDNKPQLKGKGYTKGFLPFNSRATNEYRNKTILAYPINVFMNVPEKNYYLSYGIEIDEDKYALNVLLQWIWRSAIRNGEDVYIYLPSERMRYILTSWIEETSSDKAVEIA